MDFDRLTALTKWMSGSPLAELEWSDGNLRVKLVKANRSATTGSGQAVAPAPAKQASPAVADNVVTAPFFGVVHLTPSPDTPAFVALGQEVKEGDTLCTIEAMKVFSTVAAERSGIVAEILVSPGTEVSVGQPLFRFAAD
jgi:acetyl-CoA carboxylase biotin carboxyl carrier protein